MQVSIKELIEEHGFESCQKAIEWSVSNGYQLREYTDMTTHKHHPISPEHAMQLCEQDAARVFIEANALGFDNPHD